MLPYPGIKNNNITLSTQYKIKKIKFVTILNNCISLI